MLASASPARVVARESVLGIAALPKLDSAQSSLTGQTSACQLEAPAPRETLSRAASAPLPETSSEPLTADLSRGLDLLLERHEKRRGIVMKPRNEPPPSKTDHVPAHVKRAVWKRDGGQCQWKLDGGGICGSTHRAQLDHVVPRGKGGPPTVANLRVLCAVHNDLAARQAYGDAWMARFTGSQTVRPLPETASPA
jgi:hypothetical protein